MREFLNGLLFGLSYFTILPFRGNFVESKRFYQAILISLLLSGILLYFITSILFWFLKSYFPLDYLTILVAIIYFVLYGFLHLEAICDISDGYFASLSKKDIYKILKEPYVGAIGVISVVVFIILKIMIISQILKLDISYLLYAFLLSRFSTLYILYFFEFHKNSYLANSLKSNLSLKLLLILLLTTYSILFFSLGSNKILLIMIISFLVSILITNRIQKNFGFINGDLLGFNIEINELVILHLYFLVIA